MCHIFAKNILMFSFVNSTADLSSLFWPFSQICEIYSSFLKRLFSRFNLSWSILRQDCFANIWQKVGILAATCFSSSSSSRLAWRTLIIDAEGQRPTFEKLAVNTCKCTHSTYCPIKTRNIICMSIYYKCYKISLAFKIDKQDWNMSI
jgi:hypothetical protein